MLILVVEDDPAIGRLLERGLKSHGYQVVTATTGSEGVRLASDEVVEFVILDISLPGMNGHEVLARLRRVRPRLPVLMLTARDDTGNKVAALDAGADDYVTKPFVFEELVARIRALSRRADQPEASHLRAGDLWIDLPSRRAGRGKEPVDLSVREFALLEYFMRHPGKLLSRQQILSSVWGYDFDSETNLVEVYVLYLRRKIDRKGEPSVIATVRGGGYRFDPPEG